VDAAEAADFFDVDALERLPCEMVIVAVVPHTLRRPYWGY